MRHVGKGRMVEQLEGSPDWRQAVVTAAYDAIREVQEMGAVRAGYPFTGPVDIRISLFFKKPASAPKTREVLPSTRSTGDSDKHARNIFDALQDAGVIKDDAQAVDHRVSKRYCRPGQIPGAQITVTAVAL